MTNAVITWFDKEFGLIKTEVSTISPEILAWAKNFLSTITPVIKQAAEDAVLAAVTVPGPGSVKAAAALATATADLATKGIPVIENDLKAAIQIAYNALPASVTGNTAAQAVLTAADNEVSTVAATVVTEVAPVVPATA
jgi:hypothetical protein